MKCRLFNCRLKPGYKSQQTTTSKTERNQPDDKRAYCKLETLSLYPNLERTNNAWPSYPPSLSALDYIFWGSLKEILYGENPDTIDNLR